MYKVSTIVLNSSPLPINSPTPDLYYVALKPKTQKQILYLKIYTIAQSYQAYIQSQLKTAHALF